MIIDSHTHILPDEFRNNRKHWISEDATFAALFRDTAAATASADELVAEMDRSGVDISVVLGYGWTSSKAARISNDYLLSAASLNPDRIIPFCSVDPGWGDTALVEFERCLSLGALGIGELHTDTQKWSPEDVYGLKPLMAMATEYAVPVVVHASEPIGHKYPGKGTAIPYRLIQMAAAFPDVAFVFAHFGGGIPFYALMPEVAEALSNTYFDSAATPFLYRSDVYQVSMTAAGSDRVMFGSDFPLIRQERALRSVRGAGLNTVDETLVLSGNASDLLGVRTK